MTRLGGRGVGCAGFEPANNRGLGSILSRRSFRESHGAQPRSAECSPPPPPREADVQLHEEQRDGLRQIHVEAPAPPRAPGTTPHFLINTCGRLRSWAVTLTAKGGRRHRAHSLARWTTLENWGTLHIRPNHRACLVESPLSAAGVFYYVVALTSPSSSSSDLSSSSSHFFFA